MKLNELKKCKAIYRCFQVFAISVILSLFVSSNTMSQVEIKGVNILLPHEEKIEKGTLRINSLPYEAKVFINGVYEGNTPLVKSVFPGTYEVKISKTNYGTIEKTLLVVSKGITSENFKLFNRWYPIVIIPLAITAMIVAGFVI